MRINITNLFYNQRLFFLTKCTSLIKLIKSPAILSSQAFLSFDLDEDDLFNSIVNNEGTNSSEIGVIMSRDFMLERDGIIFIK